MEKEPTRLFVRKVLKMLQEKDSADAEATKVQQALLKLRTKQKTLADRNVSDAKKQQSIAVASKKPEEKENAELKVQDAEKKKKEAEDNLKAARTTHF
jgi:hypothetical protein